MSEDEIVENMIYFIMDKEKNYRMIDSHQIVR